ncbi:hypothetical protein D3C75_898630 [compost metagenome]
MILAGDKKLILAAPFIQGDLQLLSLSFLHRERLQKGQILDDGPPALLPPDLQQQLDVRCTGQHILASYFMLIQYPSFLNRHADCISDLLRCFPGNVCTQRMDIADRSGALGFSLRFRFEPAARFLKRIDRQAQTITSFSLVHIRPIDCPPGDIQFRYSTIGVLFL